jgi:hypothetical protein
MKKQIFCTMDTETFGGVVSPKGIYHLGGIIHDRQGVMYATFNILIAEHFDQIAIDSYAKQNFDKYLEMVCFGNVTMIDTEQNAIAFVQSLCDFYGVTTMSAFNSGFDFEKTACKTLLEGKEFVDIWLLALQTIAQKKSYRQFCLDNEFCTQSKKSCSTNAQTVYAYSTGNPDYKEEHTAFEDSLIEMQILVKCLAMHKKYNKNVHCFNFPQSRGLFPPYK